MMKALLLAWSAWVAFGLPVSLSRKICAAVREPRSPAWRTGQVMFYAGILVWCPYVGFRNLAGWTVPLPPVLAAHVVLLYGGLALQRVAGGEQGMRPPRN